MRRGVTLAEVLVAASLVTVLAAGAWQMSSGADRAFERIAKDLEAQTRWAAVQEKIVRELRRGAAFATPDGVPGPVLRVRAGRGAAARAFELRWERGQVVRVEGERTEVLGRDVPAAALSFEAVGAPKGGEGRLAELRAKLAWSDATGRRSELAVQTRVFARNAPLGVLEVVEEVVE